MKPEEAEELLENAKNVFETCFYRLLKKQVSSKNFSKEGFLEKIDYYFENAYIESLKEFEDK